LEIERRLIVLDLRVAKLAVLFAAVSHMLCSYVIWYSGWTELVSLLSTAVLAWHGCFQLYRCLQLPGSSVIRIRLHAGGGARLTTPNGEISAVLVAVPYRSSLFTLLEFQAISPVRKTASAAWRRAAGNKIRVPLLVGGVPVCQRKRLACLLIYGE
jgi:hypothetical protein